MAKIFFLAACLSISCLLLNAQQTGIQTTTPWQFVKGDSVVPAASPVYGAIGSIAEGNKPGARSRGLTWVDASGNYWLFGGERLDTVSYWTLYFNDLWKYNPVTGQWTFMKGDNDVNVPGVYGVKGAPADDNRPGGRSGAACWMDNTGNLWLFGGTGYNRGNYGYLNDLWKYNPSTNQWTWVSGDNAVGVSTVYGNKGVPSIYNSPGGRVLSTSWNDNSGNLWLFGGTGYTYYRDLGNLNDIWKYDIVSGQWTWITGDSLTQVQAKYGTVGVASATNDPGGRYGGMSWTDASGNLLVFGGVYVKMPEYSFVNKNDLWQYDITTNQWTWIKGDTTVFPTGVYGNKGVGAATNTPGAREGSAAWKDASGNLWMFGGERRNANGTQTIFNDLWKYEPSLNQWTWIKGDSTFNVPAIYGTQGIPSSITKPEAKNYPLFWPDNTNGNLWLFAGVAKATNLFNFSSDLWKYNIASGQWTWTKGDSIKNLSSTYGEQGYVSEGNSPGARELGMMWKDASGNLWLFGGDADTVSGINGYKNDLWKYDVSINQWTWMKGDSSKDNNGVYRTMGVSSPGNKPGARFGAVTWTDGAGKFWMFGGFGNHSLGVGYLNDLWKYDPVTNNWTWIKGDSTGNTSGVYGAVGTPSVNNKPGSRQSAISWIDASGNLWLFGGYGYTELGAVGHLNDLWKYDPVTNQWTWMKGDKTADLTGVYGAIGVSAAANKPGSRYYGFSWADGSGNLWLFGGYGYHASGVNFLNDLWRYTISTNRWTWMKGDNTGAANGVYGAKGIESAVNKPGARINNVTWKDASGNFWLFGGSGYGESGGGNLNDLWKYNPSSNQWTWINGDKEVGQLAAFGKREVSSATTKPGGTRGAVAAIDASGNFWLYGGTGNTSAGESLLNLLFKYNPLNNEWTWVKGIKNSSQQAVFGIEGVASVNNKPGARDGSASWKDTANHLWLFGGQDNNDYLNDLWKYDIISNQWTWLKGDTTKNQFAGVYGVVQVPDIANKPGARKSSVTWTDTLGKLWLFGGRYSNGSVANRLNDLWKYDPITGMWVWMKGNNATNAFGVYGTINVPATANKPGARDGAISWTDDAGNLWLFGGEGYVAGGSPGYLNDLWRYNSSTNQWTWIKGNSAINIAGTYGTLRVGNVNNKPGGRRGAISWIDALGNLWLFGGFGYAASGSPGYLNDLWKYSPSTNQWIWMKGNNTTGSSGIYGYIGLAWGGAGEGNMPGAREGSISWLDIYGSIWLLGGYGRGINGTGYLNDLWKFNTTTNQWIWMKGDSILQASGKMNQPGARKNSISWKDEYGDLWLYGGYGNGTSGFGYLNDLWKIFAGTRYIFTGSGNWSSPSNWVGNVAPPTPIAPGMEVIINHEIPGICVKNGPVTLEQFGRLIVESGKTLNINQGDLLNEGSIVGPGNRPGVLRFTGVDMSSLQSDGDISTPIILVNKQMELSGNTVADSITFSGGSNLKLNNYSLNIGSATLNGDSANFIVTNGSGRLIRTVSNTPVTFHIGINETSYSPVTITNAGMSDHFSVRVMEGVFDSINNPITSGNVNRTWMVTDSLEGGSDVKLKMQWNIADQQPGFDLNHTRVSHGSLCPPPINCSGTYFDYSLPGAATNIAPGVYSVERSGVDNFNTNSFIVTSTSFVYTFTGNGAWNNVNNWSPGIMPPAIIPAGAEVIINHSPAPNSECVHTGDIIVATGGKLTILPGKKLRIEHN
ncbi:MAG: kelch repeat-containing protein [Chitinophagales bacterium]